MRLGVSGWRLHGQRTGIGRYLTNVLKHWTADVVAGRFDEINLYTPITLDRREIGLPDTIRGRVLGPHWRMLVWENLRLAPNATDDVVFYPSYSRPILTRGKTVVTMFDATYKLYPQFYPRRVRLFYTNLYAWSVRHATLVITATDTARQDIVRCFNVPESRIRVVPLAHATIFKHLTDASRIAETKVRYLGTAAPYFLFVGKLTARRNVPKLLEAFATFKQRTGLPHKLLIIGLNTTGLNLAEMAASLGVASDFSHAEYISDDDLIALYSGAEAFVMPYAYEALSLTALEAQATGTAVITVDVPGLREMTGGKALLMAQPEVPDMVKAMSTIASNEALRRELVEGGLAHARKFSQERTSRETLAVLEEAAWLPAPARWAGSRGDEYGV